MPPITYLAQNADARLNGLKRSSRWLPNAARMIFLAALLAFMIGGGIRAVDAAMPGGGFDGAGILVALDAVDDLSMTVDEDSSGNILDVLSNDTFGDAGPGTFAITADPSHGSALINDNGTSGDVADDWIDYTPDPDYDLTDSLTYQICDAATPTPSCDTALVSITITPINDAPVITDQATLSTPEETALTITLTDLIVTDPDNTYPDDFTLTVQDGTNYSRVNNEITPAVDFNGQLTVPVLVNDGTDDSNTYDLTVDVTAVNDAPVVTDIPNQTITEGASFTTINLDNYVSDVDNTDAEMVWTYAGNTALTVSIVSRVATITTPSADWNGAETITFRATDPGSLWDEDPATFTVTAVNDAPVVTDIPDQTIAEGASFTTINLDNYVSDVDNTDAQMVWTYTGNTALTVSIVARVATIGIPSPDWNGTETITFRATDPGSLWDDDPATFTVTAVNDTPVVTDIPNQTIAEGASFTTINLDNYVSDADNTDAQMVWTYTGNTALTVSIVSRVATIGIPNPDWNGAETITFRATDPGSLWDDDPATFTVTAVNDAPVVTDIPNQTIAEGASFTTINLDNYVSDVDNTDAQMVWTYTGNTALTVSIVARVATIGIPNPDWNGAETITFRATDPGPLWDDDPATFTVTAVNDPPVANTDNPTVGEDSGNNTINVLANDSDPESDTLTLVSVTTPPNGTTTIVSNNVRYRPNANFSGIDTFTYDVSDGHGGTSTGTVNVTVTPQNDAPVVTDIPNQTIAEGASFTTINLDNYVSDVDNTDAEMVWTYTGNTALTVSIVSRVATITTPSADWNGAETITFRATDPGSLWGEDPATFTVTAVNDAPVVTDIPDQTIAEGASFTTINLDDYVSDADNTDAQMVWTYTGNTALTVSIVDRVATIGIPNPDWNGAETVTFRATDPGPLWDEDAATFTVTPQNDAPTDITLSAANVQENQPVNTVVGAFTTVDPDVGDTFTYTLVSGTGSDDNASFNILDGNLRTSSMFNYETKSSYSIRVRSTDFGTLWYEKVFTISVTNVNENPTDINLSISAVPENSAANTVVGAFSTIDQDLGDTFTYTLVPGTGSDNNTSFNILGGNLRTSAIFDYEVKSSYSIRVRSTDLGALWTEKVFIITVTDVNDPPTDILLSSSNVIENLPINTVVGTLSSVDQDTGNTFTYSLVTGTGSDDNSSFNILDNNLRTSASFDYESKSSYSIRIRTTDQGTLWAEKVFTISILNGNENPTDISLTPASVQENAIANTVVGTLSSLDPDPGNTFTYALVAGTGSDDNASFNILGTSLRTSGVFNYEIKNTYTIRVRTTDQGSLFFEKVLTITVTNVNENPTDISISVTTVPENSVVNTVVSPLTTIDQDLSDTYAYTLVPGPGSDDNASFNILGSNLRTSAVFNYEVKNSYSIRLRTTDQGGLFFEKAFTITVTNVNEAPVANPDSYNATEGNWITIAPRGVLTNDTDPETPLTITLNTGSLIQASHGIVYPSTDGGFTWFPYSNELDYYGTDTFQYKASDGSLLSEYATVTINIANVNDTPVGLTDSYTLDEDTILTTTVVDGVLVNDTDADNLSPTPPNTGLTAVKVANPAHGTVTLNADGSFTYTPTADYYGADSFTYKAKDPTLLESPVTTVNLTINNIQDNPVGVADSYSVNEDATLTLNAATGVLANDTDGDNLPPAPANTGLTAIKLSDPTHLKTPPFILNADGSFTYTPVDNYYGADSFTYQTQDPTPLISQTVTVSITVNPVNDLPNAVNDTRTTDEDTPVVIDVLANDTFGFDGPSTDPLAVTVAPAHGTAVVDQNGTSTNPTDDKINYTPAANYFGGDSLTYQICDSAIPHKDCVTATVSITINSINDPPAPATDNYTLNLLNGTGDGKRTLVIPLGQGVLANDTDADNTLQAINASDPPHGSITLNPDGSFTYVADAVVDGQADTFTYQAKEVEGSTPQTSEPVTVTIMVDLVKPPIPLWVNPSANYPNALKVYFGAVNLIARVPAPLPPDLGYVRFTRWDYVHLTYVDIGIDTTPQIGADGSATFTSTLYVGDLLLQGTGVNEIFIYLYDTHGNYIRNDAAGGSANRVLLDREPYTLPWRSYLPAVRK